MEETTQKRRLTIQEGEESSKKAKMKLISAPTLRQLEAIVANYARLFTKELRGGDYYNYYGSLSSLLSRFLS